MCQFRDESRAERGFSCRDQKQGDGRTGGAAGRFRCEALRVPIGGWVTSARFLGEALPIWKLCAGARVMAGLALKRPDASSGPTSTTPLSGGRPRSRLFAQQVFEHELVEVLVVEVGDEGVGLLGGIGAGLFDEAEEGFAGILEVF